VMRGLLGVGVAYLLMLAIRDVGVSQALAAFFIYPAISYALGIVWLGERGTVAKWIAVAFGFAGILVVIDPDLNATNISICYALVAAVLASVRVAMHRRDSEASTPMVSVLYDRGVGALLATAAAAVAWTPIAASAAPAVLGLALSSVAAQLLFVYAVARAPLGVLAPFAFWEVIFAILLDISVLGAPATWPMAIGATLIVVAGLLLSRK